MIEYILTFLAVLLVWLVFEIVCKSTFDTSCWEQLSLRYEISKKINNILKYKSVINLWTCHVDYVYYHKENLTYHCNVIFKRKIGFFKVVKRNYTLEFDNLIDLINDNYLSYLFKEEINLPEKEEKIDFFDLY